MNQWTSHTEAYQALLERMTRLAEQHGYVINQDGDRVQKVIGLMTENLIESGNEFCPCKQSHPLNAQKDVTCPCLSWENEIEKDGHCFCRLFFAKTV